MKKEMMIEKNEDLVEDERANHQAIETALTNDWDNDNEDNADDNDDEWDDDWYPKPNRHFLPSTNIELIIGNIRRKLKS